MLRAILRRSNDDRSAEIADSDIFWTEPRDLSMDEMSSRINDKAQASISSHHTYGALVLFADGSVRLLDERTTPAELRTMLSVGDSSP